MVLRHTDWDTGLPQEQVAEIMDRYSSWFHQLLESGIITGGRPLLSGGRMITCGSDEPFVDSKEMIGGYIQLTAPGFKEAVEIAKTFPPLEVGVRIELRELIDECPVLQRHGARLFREITIPGML